jgi:hypothetical protein
MLTAIVTALSCLVVRLRAYARRATAADNVAGLRAEHGIREAAALGKVLRVALQVAHVVRR